MAYDRPSPKLLSFLAKHYRLTDSVPQVGSGWSSRFVLGSWLPSSSPAPRVGSGEAGSWLVHHHSEEAAPALCYPFISSLSEVCEVFVCYSDSMDGGIIFFSLPSG